MEESAGRTEDMSFCEWSGNVKYALSPGLFWGRVNYCKATSPRSGPFGRLHGLDLLLLDQLKNTIGPFKLDMNQICDDLGSGESTVSSPMCRGHEMSVTVNKYSTFKSLFSVHCTSNGSREGQGDHSPFL